MFDNQVRLLVLLYDGNAVDINEVLELDVGCLSSGDACASVKLARVFTAHKLDIM